MNYKIIVLCIFLWNIAYQPVKVTSNKEEWLSLFNGSDLSGWDIKIAGYSIRHHIPIINFALITGS